MRRSALSMTAIALGAVAVFFAADLGCSPPGSNRPTGPLRVLRRQGGSARGGCLVAFLPGLGDVPEDYEDQGFAAALQRARVDADLRLVDAHFGYYREQSVVPRLIADVIEPAEAAGYEHIWLVGISLGGLGSLALASEHPDRFDGLVLLAPYLGDDAQVDQVREAGWPEGSPVTAVDEPFGRIWKWLAARDEQPTIFLAFGDADRFAAGHRLLAGVLPANDVLIGAGGHRWTVWSELWAAFVQSGRLQRACGVRASAAAAEPGNHQ